MKIFGWMHKKLHIGTTDLYHSVTHKNSPDVDLDDEIGAGKRGTMLVARVKKRETEPLLLPHMLLTIGTLGHPQQQIVQEQQQEEEPLSTDHEQDLIKSAPNPTATATALIPKPAESTAIEKQEEVVIIEEEITSQEPLLKEDKEKIEKRTTLADLFKAETACVAGESPDAATLAAAKGQTTTTSPTKNSKRIKKTKNKEKKESSPTNSAAAATKNIHRMITRVLKKRIHPDQLARAGEDRHRHRHGRRGGASDGGQGRRRRD